MEKDERREMENRFLTLHIIDMLHEAERDKKQEPFVEEVLERMASLGKMADRPRSMSVNEMFYHALNGMTAEGKENDPHFRKAAVMFNDLFQRTPKIESGINYWSDKDLEEKFNEKHADVKEKMPKMAEGPYQNWSPQIEGHLDRIYARAKKHGLYGHSQAFHKAFVGTLKEVGKANVSGGWKPKVSKPKVIPKSHAKK